MPRTPSTVVLAALLVLPGLLPVPRANAEETPQSRVQGRHASGLGILDLRGGSRLEGRYLSGGACRFEPERRVLEAEWQGDVLVGTVTVCQTGPSCTEKTYPFLGFVEEATGSVVTRIALDAGCQSPALGADGRLILEPSAGKTRSSALELSRRKGRQRKVARLAERSFASGQQLLQGRRYDEAAQAFLRALSYDERHWPAYLALGVAEFNLGRVESALSAYERSREIKPDFADTYVNLACAHARLGDKQRALDNLRRAIGDLGFSEPDLLSADPDLLRLLRDEPEFNDLVRQASLAKQERSAAKRVHRGRR